MAVRAHSTVVGVSGALYRAGHSLPRFVTITTIAYTDPASRWIQAGQLVRTLHDCTPTAL